MVLVTDKTWVLNATLSATVFNTSGLIDDIATAITAGASGWTVVANDVVSSGRQILLKPPADSDLPDMKLAIFGGVAPAGANIASFSSTSNIYIVAHENHPADSFDADFNASQMLTGAGFVSGRVWSVYSTSINSVRVVSNGNQLALIAYNSASSAPMWQCIGGIVARKPSGQHIVGVAAIGNTPTTATQLTGFSTGLITGDETPSTTTAAVQMYIDGTQRTAARVFTTLAQTLTSNFRTRDDGRYFVTDIPLIDQDGFSIGYANQVTIGRDSNCFTEYAISGGDSYIALSHSLSALGQAFWLKSPAA